MQTTIITSIAVLVTLTSGVGVAPAPEPTSAHTECSQGVLTEPVTTSYTPLQNNTTEDPQEPVETVPQSKPTSLPPPGPRLVVGLYDAATSRIYRVGEKLGPPVGIDKPLDLRGREWVGKCAERHNLSLYSPECEGALGQNSCSVNAGCEALYVTWWVQGTPMADPENRVLVTLTAPDGSSRLPQDLVGAYVTVGGVAWGLSPWPEIYETGVYTVSVTWSNATHSLTQRTQVLILTDYSEESWTVHWPSSGDVVHHTGVSRGS